MDQFLFNGTTTLEAKSGYGLSLDDEIKSLNVIKRINQNHILDLIPTFLGAHAIPNEYKNDKEQIVSDDPDFIDMDGIGILSFFNSRVPKAIYSIIENNNLDISQIKLIVPHQASKLAIDGIMKQLKLDESRFYFDIHNTGNLTSASIPLALSQLLHNDKIIKGDYIVCCGFGVGLSWSTTLLRYE